ncbi:MAG: hypothetical protein U0174_13990 [Polyangiaceae bacterium]
MKRAVPCVLAASIVFGLACSEDVVGHIFRGRKYDQAGGCLEIPTAVDVVEGSDPGEGCPLGCLVRKEGDGGTTVYIATTCPPYPNDFVRADETPICQEARTASEKGFRCGSDAGRIPAPSDASADVLSD